MKRPQRPCDAFLVWAALAWIVASATSAVAAPGDFPRPPELERDVAFWKRIYSEVSTNAGLIHDTRDLGLVYEVTKIPPGLSSDARERHTERRKAHYEQILRRLAKGRRSGLSAEEQRVLALFPRGVSNSTLKGAAGRLRFQLGQANKFREGVIRSGAFKPHVLATLREMNLPLEIAHLPHVESSYQPGIYSRVGAAGLWQFTRSTGRRFMRVDHIVDERLDPYRASVAAARLLEQNHRVTGTWPLAITAYNHGASGMRRAARKLGTRDITTIVRKYRSRSFGFASRNFYVEFLAANAVASDPEFYFGPLVLDRPTDFETIELPFYARASDLVKALGVERSTLETANPSLRPTVWKGVKRVPKGFALRVPRAALSRPLGQAVSALPASQRHARQTRDADYVVQRGDTLSTIARRHGVSMSELVALNGLASRHHIRVGQKLKLPADIEPTRGSAPRAASKAETTRRARPASPPAASAASTPPEDGTYVVRRGDHLTRIADRFGISIAELMAMNDLPNRNRIHVGQRLRVTPETPPATPRPAATLLPESVAASSTHASDESEIEPGSGLLADPTDYTVAPNQTILVQTDETLGHYAEWLGLRASRLRKINGLRFGEQLVVQQRLRLDFAHVSPEVFERIRIDYHRALQETFFAEWEIEGTLNHRVGAGDSLWVLSTRRYVVPIWLLRQYNPDVDLEALTAGTTIMIPKLRRRADPSGEIAEANPGSG